MNTAFPSLVTPNLDALKTGAAATGTAAGSRPKLTQDARMHAQAQDFEVQFVNSMFQHMYTGLDGDGPFGGSTGTGPWRSFLTEEYAKNFVKQGGIGIADSVYKSLLAHQEAHAKPAAQ
jgi:Rod binding domain-containing protein